MDLMVLYCTTETRVKIGAVGVEIVKRNEETTSNEHRERKDGVEVGG